LATPPDQPYPPDRREISLHVVFHAIEAAVPYGSLREMSSRLPFAPRDARCRIM
jgi:hypothetical protein